MSEIEVEKKTEKEETKKPIVTKNEEQVAIILIRSLVKIRKDIRDTIRMLSLFSKNNCVIIKKTASTAGMLKKIKDYVTWGEINEETIKKLKKMRIMKNETYRLHPPIGGFERKGIKTPYQMGGALGYRGKEINKLIEKMCG